MHIPKPGHGNGVAITLAALAVVIAGTGTATAVAVSSTTVHIEDGYIAGRFAHVDKAGHLSTTGATSTIDLSGRAYSTFRDNYLSSPTTATLAISKITLSDSVVNSTATTADVEYALYKVGVSGGACSSATSNTLLGMYEIGPGQNLEDVFPAPLLVTPTGSAQYCLDLGADTINGNYNATYVPVYDIAAYVISGTYAGIGSNSALDKH